MKSVIYEELVNDIRNIAACRDLSAGDITKLSDAAWQSRIDELHKDKFELIELLSEATKNLLGAAKKVDALEKDAARLDWLESSKEMHAFCHTGYGEYRYYAQQQDGYKTVRDVIDTAMQSEKGGV